MVLLGMGLKENLDLIGEAIESLECPKPLPRGVTKAYKEVLEVILKDDFDDMEVMDTYLVYLIYYDRIKEEEEGLRRGRYTEKRAGFKV